MKLECKVLLQNRSGNQLRSPKPVKGFVTLGEKKTKDGNTHSVQISTQQNRNQTPIQLSRENVIDIKSKFVPAGRLTMEFKNPSISLFISEANADRLRIFVKTCISMVKGEKVECNKLEEIKSTAFQQTTSAKALNRKDYTAWKSQGYPSSLTEITFINCDIKMIDMRWFHCKKLVRLDLSGNLLGSEAKEISKLRLLAKLVNLKELNLSQNGLQKLPYDIILPESLLSLNLSNNLLSWFPKSILKLGNLRKLNLSSNFIVQVPPELIWLPISDLDLSNNRIQYLPYCFIRKRLQSCFIGGNSPGVLSQRKPTVSSLLCLAFAKVKQYRYDELTIPWDVRLLENALLRRCSTCMQYVDVDGNHAKIVQITPINFAVSVDDNAAFPMELNSCRSCVPMVRHLLNPNPN